MANYMNGVYDYETVELSESSDIFSPKSIAGSYVFGRGGNDVFSLNPGTASSSTEYYGDSGDDRFIIQNNEYVGYYGRFFGGVGTDTVEITTDRYIVMNIGTDNSGGIFFDTDYNTVLGVSEAERFVIQGSAFGDALMGGTGNDWLDGRGGDDSFTETKGNDSYVFNSQFDRVYGTGFEDGIDTIWTTVSVDLRQQWGIENLRLQAADIDGTGNDSNNVITGFAGSNKIAGGAGNDSLYGKGGADTFIFSEVGAKNKDSIWDFDADDKIALTAPISWRLGTGPEGTLAAEQFVIGTSATQDFAQVIYNRLTGVLSYDADGTGSEFKAEDIAFIGKKLDFVDHNYIVLA